MTQAFPLQWPDATPRTPPHKRVKSRFDVTAGAARVHLLKEALSSGKSPVISTNMPLRRDGKPYAGRREPDDPGVAVFFYRDNRQICFACDKYQHVWENMRAIGKTLEALRGIDRWGTAEFLNQAFQGFTALPPPDQMSDIIVPPTQKQWWQVLGVSQDCPLVVAEGAYKALCRDRGGADVELNAAIDAARKVAP